MSGSLNYGVQVAVDIWPRNGTRITMSESNGYLRGVGTSKDFRQDYGQFTITLSPGGPSGTAGQTWTQLLPPMSLVLISITRGGYRQTVMQGIILNVSETQDWTQKTPQRQTTVQGADISYLFATRSFYTLAALVGSPLGALPNVNQIALLSQGAVSGTPASVCKSWLNSIIFGNSGILSGVTFNGPDGNKVKLSAITGTRFDEFDGAGIEIPFGANYIGDQTTFSAKFREFLEDPYYEFFITTAAPGAYAETEALAPMSSPSGLYGDVSTVIVGRMNPWPRLVNNGSGAAPKWSVDSTLWNKLARFTTDTPGAFLESEVAFSCEAVGNFYVLNPTSIGTLLGQGNSQITGPLNVQVFYSDFDSRDTFGYLPVVQETRWLYDPVGIQAQQNVADAGGFQELFDVLLARLISVHHPAYLMANASVVLPLRPDILPGNVFTYVPFKDGVVWEFYVQGVSHSVQPPQGGATTLTLTRGLPQTVYADDALLLAVLLGQADRVEGVVKPGVHAGIVPIQFGSGADATAYSTPQGGKQPSASGGS